MSEFEEIYNLYHKDVYYFVMKLTDYRDSVAEEVTQESFYQAFISIKRFRGECTMKTWLCRIARNTYYRYLKKHAKETCLDEEICNVPNESNIADLTEEKQMTIHIGKVIDTLDERSRAIVEYRYVDL